MSSKTVEKLQQKIFHFIVLKNSQLKQFARVVLDYEFLHFAELIVDCKRFLEEFVAYREPHITGNIFVTLVERKVEFLCISSQFCLKKLDSYKNTILNSKSSTLRKIFNQRLNRTKTEFRESYRVFQLEINEFLNQHPDIYQIAQNETFLKRTSFLYLTVENNLNNITYVLKPESNRYQIVYNIAFLKWQVCLLLYDFLIRCLHLFESMDYSEGDSSLESIRGRLNHEISKSRTELLIQEAEIDHLRQELFPSETSLKEQRNAAIDQLEVQELDLEHRIRSIDDLQTDIQGLESQVAQLVEERERIHGRLMAKREALRKGIREVVRLEKLIKKIEKEISDRMVEFQEHLEKLELKRLAILDDDTLTEDERNRLLAELEEDIEIIRKKHDADQNVLKTKCEELKALSRSMIDNLDVFRDELAQKHLDEIRELEIRKNNATPSELAIINARIVELQNEFQENMEMLDKAHARPIFYEDETGRYYINDLGQKVYQRKSGASEYIFTEDGCWERIKEALEILSDDKGEYYFDSFGRKIYTKKFFEDEFGKYFIDNSGKRIYQEASSLSEISLKHPEEVTYYSATTEPSGSDESMLYTSGLDISEQKKQQRDSDVNYIQNTLGSPLRKGLAIAFLQQPTDPIEFIAAFLVKYDKDQKRESERVLLINEIERMRIDKNMTNSNEEIPEDFC